MPEARESRRRAIVDLLGATAVRSQAQLQELLARRGHDANQATLSRDLRDLGVAKGPRGYALAESYALAENGTPADPAAGLARALGTWLVSAASAQHTVVLRTPPGGAQPLALALDRAHLDGVLGTVAGDDTILVVCPTPARARRLAREVERLRR